MIFQLKNLLWISFIFLLVPYNLIEERISPDPLSTAPLVIGVAEWRQDSGAFIDIQERAYSTLYNLITSAALTDVTVVKLPISLDNATQAEPVAGEYGVDMILWGWYDPVAIRSYVDLANATEDNGLTNSLDAYLKNGGSTQAIRVLKLLSELDYDQNGLYFCVPRWTP
jgi:hypothetical protein